MSPSDRPDASLLSDAQLLEELKRRRECRAAGVCDYCGARPTPANRCGEGERHAAAAKHSMLLWAKLDAPLPPDAVQRLRDAEAAAASGAPPVRPAVPGAADMLEAELVGEVARELRRLRKREVPVDLAHLMTEIGEVATAMLERGAPSRGELVQVAATALGWADRAQRQGQALAEARDRALDAREAEADTDSSRFEALDRAAGPAAYTLACTILRQAAQERAGRRGGLQLVKVDGERLLRLLDDPSVEPVRAVPGAGEAMVALRVGVKRGRGGPMLSNVRALALAMHFEDCALSLAATGHVPRATIGPNT